MHDAIDFIVTYKQRHPDARKAEVQNACAAEFSLKRERSVLVGSGYTLRFSEAQGRSFANTVLSLSALEGHDANPFVVVVVRRDDVEFLLANSTMIRKVSHSSRDLAVGRVRGSFNGSDILREFDGLDNTPANFDELFALHVAFSWDENVERLAAATNAIIPRENRFHPNALEESTILAAPVRAAAALKSESFRSLGRVLVSTVYENASTILRLAEIDNVNLRGNEIEQAITGDRASHRLHDLEREFADGHLSIDIKTKLLDRTSAPKAYNVDKMLRFLAQPNTVAAFLLIGVDLPGQQVTASLLPVFEQSLLEVTRVQHHWAGRGSRGVTQLSGSFTRVLDPHYEPTVSINDASLFLRRVLAL